MWQNCLSNRLWVENTFSVPDGRNGFYILRALIDVPDKCFWRLPPPMDERLEMKLNHMTDWRLSQWLNSEGQNFQGKFLSDVTKRTLLSPMDEGFESILNHMTDFAFSHRL